MGLFTFIFNINAQKEDYIMFSGYDSENFLQGWGNVTYNFNQNPVNIQYEYQANVDFFFAYSSLCDANGNLLFYSNGTKVLDNTYQPMLNGDSINTGSPLAYGNLGYGFPNGVLIVPRPSTSQYYLFQDYVGQLPNPDNRRYANLKVSTINMALNNGKGKVIQKNNVLDTTWLSASFLSATRHANGRDWWLMTRNKTKNEYYTYLISPDGISNRQVQTIDIPAPYDPRGTTHLSNFSPDGSKLISGDWVQGVTILDFDRCTGQVSNKRIIPIDTFASGRIGVCFSPNSRYLYIVRKNYILQADTEASDIMTSVDTVAHYDGFIWMNGVTPNATPFFLPYNTPDGRIFISAGGGSNRYLHTIENPNEQGVACNVQQHSILLPTWNNGTTPNFPTYRLGALVGSGCDTIAVGSEQVAVSRQRIRVFPNPTNGVLNVEIPQNAVSLQYKIHDVLGRNMQSGALQNQISLKTLNNGIYYLHIYNENNGVGYPATRVIVQHD
jgi:hypothetical protein